MKSLLLFLGAILLALVASLPLDDYVNLADSSYKWELVSTSVHDGYTLYGLKLTSQTWSFVNTDKPVWQHWLKIIVPDNIPIGRNALIYINGGGNPLGSSPSEIFDILPPIALELGDIVAELNQIPNQPLVFEGEDFGRSEDSLLAKSWDLFIETRDPMVVARLPMAKAVVKAMDAIQEFISTLPTVPVPRGFLLSGGSKRGWTTWLAGAADTRVVAMAPLVIDILDMIPNINEIYQTYGKWPVALKDYTSQNVTRCLNCPVFQELAAVEDPLVYLDRFRERNVPIFAINSCGDEFFIPTSSKYWYPQYTGEAFLGYMPNAEHSLATAIRRVVDILTTFTYTIDNNIARPRFEFEVSTDQSQITVTTSVPARTVKLWEAYNKRSRRFILNCYLTCLWTSSRLSDLGNGTYVAKVEIPTEGYRAFMVEVEYDIGWQRTFTSTSSVSVVPDVYDEPACPDSVCALCSTC